MPRTVWRATGFPPPAEQVRDQIRSPSGFTWRTPSPDRPEATQALPIADEFRATMSLVHRLAPDRQDPEAFHMAKAEAEERLAALARRMEAA